MDLNQLEAKLQLLIEQKLSSTIPGINIEDQFINKLATALRQSLLEQQPTNSTAPNVITLIVGPEDASIWKNPDVISALKSTLEAVSKDAGLIMDAQPVITVAVDETFAGHQVTVLASQKLEPVEDTKGMAINSENTDENNQEQGNETFPDNAFLIVEGVRVYPLKLPVVNIGRRLENQLVIDDPRISRNHAQLRAINGRFVIFDLNSTGGTFVNGQKTNQTVLYPGDVISLAGVGLIFGQDNPPARPDLTDTSPFKETDQKNRPTATLDQNTVELQTDRLTRDKKTKK